MFTSTVIYNADCNLSMFAETNDFLFEKVA